MKFFVAIRRTIRFAALRVEFLRNRARCHRFAEEVRLIKEEQRRTLVSLDKAALDWDVRVSSQHQLGHPVIQEGLACYAAKQADIRRSLMESFWAIWDFPIAEIPLYTMDEGMEDDDEVPAGPEGQDGNIEEDGDDDEALPSDSEDEGVDLICDSDKE